MVEGAASGLRSTALGRPKQASDARKEEYRATISQRWGMMIDEAAMATDELHKEVLLIGATILTILILATLVLVGSGRKPSPVLVPSRVKRPKPNTET